MRPAEVHTKQGAVYWDDAVLEKYECPVDIDGKDVAERFATLLPEDVHFMSIEGYGELHMATAHGLYRLRRAEEGVRSDDATRICNLMEKNDELADKARALGEKNRALEATRDSLERALRTSNEALMAAEGRIRAMTDQKAALMNTLAGAEKQLSTGRKEKRKLEREKDDLEKESRILSENLSRTELERVALQTKLSISRLV